MIYIPRDDITRKLMGYPSPAWTYKGIRGVHIPKAVNHGGEKILAVKVQVPYGENSRFQNNGDLLLYSKNRTLACTIRRFDGPAQYDRITEVVRTRGFNGTKAYFMAKLESAEILVVKISEVLAEQPW